MKTYHKIKTVFKRNPNDNFKTVIYGEYSLPEFEYLKDNRWVFTEKVDGTNIRVMWDKEAPVELEFRGKTDKAQLQKCLIEPLEKLFSAEKMESVFGLDPVCLYGEGYGPKINKGGKYRDDHSFVLFDIRIGRWWLQRSDVAGIAKALNVNVVPIIGYGTLKDMVGEVQQGLHSEWGCFPMEGIVARPETELYARNGARIITKIKYKDFPKS